MLYLRKGENSLKIPPNKEHFGRCIYCLGSFDPIARQPSPCRAGKESAGGMAVPVVAFNVASSAVRCIVESQR